MALRANGKIADGTTLIEFFEREEQLKKIGGEEYLAKIVSNSALEPELEEFADILIELQNRRNLVSLAQSVESKALKPNLNETSASIAMDAQKTMSNIITGAAGIKPPVLANTGIKNLVQNFKNRKETGTELFLSTGMQFLDNRLGGGFFAPDLIILAGRPSMGKTTLANQIALNVSRQKSLKNPDRTTSILYQSFEMKEDQLNAKLLTANAYGEFGFQFDSKKIRDGSIDIKHLELMETLAEQSIGAIHIDDRSGLALHELQTAAHSHIRKNGHLDLMIVDYLQIAKFIAAGGWANKSEMIGDFTTGLKNLAKDLDIPILVLSQLSRQVEQRDDKRPQLSDLRESGSIEQDADAVLFVYREEYYVKRSEPKPGTEKHIEWKCDMLRLEHRIDVIAAKQRHGPVGSSDGFIDMKTGFIGDHKPEGATDEEDNNNLL